MRATIRGVIVILVVSLGVIAVAPESWAALAGGSRLLFYYTQKSLVNPAAAAGSAATIIGITNQSTTTAVKVRVNIFNGSTCANFGPVTFDLSARRTLRFTVGSQVSAASFPEGWVDVYAVNAGGTPIRWDQLSGKGTILDFGGVNTAAVTYEAAALFSDVDRVSGTQGGVIATIDHANTWGALEGTVDFWASGGSFGTGNRLIVIPVSDTPGTAPAAHTGSNALSARWFKTDETQTRNANIEITCMVASSLADLHPDFAATYPNTGSVNDGGNIDISTDIDVNKGLVGALFETASSPALLAVHSLQQFVGPTEESHE